MSSKIEIPASTAAAQKTVTESSDWKGLTLDELKMRRAKWLIRRELGRMSLSQQYQSTRNNVSQNGVRALLFNTGEVAMLKKTDYMYLGYKALRLLVQLYIKHKRR
ncbi:MAG: hypothetical protein IKT03_04335 [Muribaculaceae bacterium]|nr:hypothetical protein [Muribaculaceae bacterium]MBR6489745.1 hypothetical protein [Muribaculaceae bacterium]